MKALLAQGFDAVFVGCGAPRGRDLDLPGRKEAAARARDFEARGTDDRSGAGWKTRRRPEGRARARSSTPRRRVKYSAMRISEFVRLAAMSAIVAVSVLGGGWFLSRVHKLYSETRAGAEVAPLKVFLQSNEYLAILFCGLAIDAVVNMKTIADLI